MGKTYTPRRKKEDITINMKFNRWTVIGPPETQDSGQTGFLCRCDCGTEKLLLFRHLGWNKSCGCLRKEKLSVANTTHGIYKNHGPAAYQRWIRYGLSVDDYDSLMFKQNGSCAICRKELVGKDLCVDHCHNSNAVRGLLCSECNIGLGKFGDNIELLYAAANYLLNSMKEVMPS